jgi:hypothetical protein
MEEVPGNMVFDFDFNFEALLRTEETQQITNRKEESTVSFHDIYVQKRNKQKIINNKEICAATVNNNLKQKKGRNRKQIWTYHGIKNKNKKRVRVRY